MLAMVALRDSAVFSMLAMVALRDSAVFPEFGACASFKAAESASKPPDAVAAGGAVPRFARKFVGPAVSIGDSTLTSSSSACLTSFLFIEVGNAMEPVSMRESFGLLALIGCTATSVSLALTLEGFFISKEGETLNVPNLALEDALAVVASINT